jgi:hypothetical protein
LKVLLERIERRALPRAPVPEAVVIIAPPIRSTSTIKLMSSRPEPQAIRPLPAFFVGMQRVVATDLPCDGMRRQGEPGGQEHSY